MMDRDPDAEFVGEEEKREGGERRVRRVGKNKDNGETSRLQPPLMFARIFPFFFIYFLFFFLWAPREVSSRLRPALLCVHVPLSCVLQM